MSGNPLRSEVTCPKCGAKETSVRDSRGAKDGTIRRRRECDGCKTRFSTVEIALDVLRGIQGDLEVLDKMRAFLQQPIGKRVDTEAA